MGLGREARTAFQVRAWRLYVGSGGTPPTSTELEVDSTVVSAMVRTPSGRWGQFVVSRLLALACFSSSSTVYVGVGGVVPARRRLPPSPRGLLRRLPRPAHTASAVF